MAQHTRNLFGTTISAARSQRGMSRNVLARKAEAATGTLEKWENGEMDPPAKASKVILLADALRINTVNLLGIAISERKDLTLDVPTAHHARVGALIASSWDKWTPEQCAEIERVVTRWVP